MCVYEVLPCFSYDCRANNHAVQRDETGAVTKDEIYNSDADAFPAALTLQTELSPPATFKLTLAGWLSRLITTEKRLRLLER